MKKLSSNQEHISALLAETIEMMCEKGLFFKFELKIQGCIGITMDSDCFFVHVNKTFNNKEESICTSTGHGDQIKDEIPTLQKFSDLDQIKPISEVNLDDIPDIHNDNCVIDYIQEVTIKSEEVNHSNYQAQMQHKQNINQMPKIEKHAEQNHPMQQQNMMQQQYMMQQQQQQHQPQQQHQSHQQQQPQQQHQSLQQQQVKQMKRKSVSMDGIPMAKQARMKTPQKMMPPNLSSPPRLSSATAPRQQQMQNIQQQQISLMQQQRQQQMSQMQQQQFQQQQMNRIPQQQSSYLSMQLSPIRAQPPQSDHLRMKAIRAPQANQQSQAIVQHRFNSNQMTGDPQRGHANNMNNMNNVGSSPGRMVNPGGVRPRASSQPPRPALSIRGAKNTVVEGVSRKGFAFKREMTVVTTYTCNYCGNQYKHQKSLDRHQKAVHNAGVGESDMQGGEEEEEEYDGEEEYGNDEEEYYE